MTLNPAYVAKLIDESRIIEEQARGIQGDRELTLADSEIERQVQQYQEWFARAIAVLADERRDAFRKEYEGSFFSNKIKDFFLNPGEPSLVGGDLEDGSASPFPYWTKPFDTTFRGPLLAQRQILIEAQQLLVGNSVSLELDLVEKLCRGFSDFLVPLANRQRSRPPIVMEDEYDVQDFLHALLRIHFDDVRPEDFSPERAGARSRVDFVLKPEKIIVEAKMTRSGLGPGKVGEELIIDIERYRGHPDCGAIVAFVYDPEKRITNRRSLESDLSGKREGLEVRVIVVQ